MVIYMSKTTQSIIAIIIVVVLAAVGIIYVVNAGKFNRIPDNAIGNTAGNLNNDGLMCEDDGIVYFSNPYDNGALYSMTPDGEDLKKLNDLSVKFINAGGKYVFFYGKKTKTTSGLGGLVSKPAMYQLPKKGGSLKALTKDVSQNMVLVGNSIYYQHYREKEGTTFARLDLKDKSSTELLDFMINPSCYYNGNFYYNGLYDDHFLYSFGVNDTQPSMIWQNDIWFPIFDGEYVYYIDALNGYKLCRYSFGNNEIEILTNDKVEYYNLYDGVIYYQKNSAKEPALKRMACDGSNNEVVASGNFSSVNITSEYAYFIEFGTDFPLYYTPTFGSVNIQEFTQARDAAIREATK